MPNCSASCANTCSEHGHRPVDRRRRQGNRRRQVPRLVRLRRTDRHDALAPRAGPAPRPQRRHAARRAGPRLRTRSGSRQARHAQPLRAAHRRPLRHQDRRTARPTNGWPTPCAGPGRSRSSPHLELELMNALRERAEEEAIHVFGAQPEGPAARRPGRPARHDGPRPRHPHRRARSPSSTPPARCSTPPPSTRTSRATTGTARIATIGRLAAKHQVSLIAIGNGTASRETDKLAQDVIKRYPEARADQDRGLGSRRLGLFRLRIRRASEFPDLDVSHARRGLHRPPPAGPAGRTGQDRPEIHRRRPVPARRLADQAGAHARCRGRGLRQRRRRRRQYRLGAAAGAHFRPERPRWPPTS